MEDMYRRPGLALYEKKAQAGRRLADRAKAADDRVRENGKSLRVAAFPQGGHSVPAVRVAGKWLERFGFRLGDGVVLTASPGRIVISKRKGA